MPRSAQQNSSIDEVESASELSPKQKREAEERVAVTAPVVHEAIRKQGDEEPARPASALAWSGFAAGLTMGFLLIAEGLMRSHLPDSSWGGLLVSFGYPLGYLIVIIGRQQFFTAHTLTAVIPFLARRDRETAFRSSGSVAIIFHSHLCGRTWAVYTRDCGFHRYSGCGDVRRASVDRLGTGLFLPTLLGNILGGVSLVSLLNHAQMVSGRGGSRRVL